MIVAVTDRGEGLGAKLALVRFFTSVDPHVHNKISTLIEGLVAPHAAKARREWIAYVHYNITALSRLSDRFFVFELKALPLLVAGFRLRHLSEWRGVIVVAEHMSVFFIRTRKRTVDHRR